jgi:CheY-like chemotaxis protein
MHTISNGAADIIKQLLSFSRKGELETKTFSLNSFIKEAFKFAEKTMPASIEHICDSCKSDQIVIGDPNILQQALINLLNNACDAVTDCSKPQIICRVSHFTATEEFKKRHPELAAREFARITVQDNGSGIPKECLDKIFEPFFTTKGVGEGSGLGLAMVFGAAKAHGGVVEVESELGQGSSFHIFLPTVRAEINEVDSDMPVARGYGETVLLVDDDARLIEITEEILIALGYKVVRASNGVSGLDTFNTDPASFDLILTDIVMPKMSGIDLIKRVRESGNSTPVIFMTGYHETLPKQIHEELKGIEVIHKPFAVEELSLLIRDALEIK